MADPRLEQYEKRHGCRLAGPLGPTHGQDGVVLRSEHFTATKFFDSRERFERELEVYQILEAKGIHTIAGHAVPQLIRADDELLAIEMTIVQRPFLLDFAGAKRPHEVPDFEQHVLDEHMERLAELFGARVGDALHVAEMFCRATGFVLLDIHPGNIAFTDTAES